MVIVLVAINPARQTQQARNTQRRADVLTILNGVNQYFVDNAAFPEGTYSTCPATDTIGKTNAVDLDNSLNPTYLAGIPSDPSAGYDEDDTGYTICESATGDRITVGAPESLNDGESSTISATR